MCRVVIVSVITLVTLVTVLLAPVIRVTADTVIVNTRISSAIIDGHGAAISVAPLSCGVDTELWCSVAVSFDKVSFDNKYLIISK